MMLFRRMYRFVLFTCSLFLVTSVFAEAKSIGKHLDPFRIAGNLYYIGDTYVASYLVVTPKGNILINSNFEADVTMLKSNIEQLGFKFKDTKILLISHAHNDHAGGSALVKEMTGAKYMVMDSDVFVVESGGKDDFHYGSSDDPENLYQPAKVDRVLHDGDKVLLGETALVAHHTGGHTKGCTTWTMKVNEGGKTYNIVIVGGPYVNPGYKLIDNKSYPTIADDYKHTFAVLKSLPIDIFLGAHGMYFNLDQKYQEMKAGKKNVFVDPEGYMQFVLEKEKYFKDELDRQKNHL